MQICDFYEMDIWDLCSGDMVEIIIPPVATTKAGTIQPTSFTGEPLLYAVEFDTPFADTSYAVLISGQDSRLFTYQSKTVAGFTINANSDTPLTGEVSWTATVIGETS